MPPIASRRLAFALAPLLVAIASAEAALRLGGWPGDAATARFAHRSVYWTAEPNLRAAGLLHLEEGVSFPVSTGVDGLRAPFHARERTDHPRIAAMGCSTTFGWGVGDAEAWPARLEVELEGVEVVNAGQPGHATTQGKWLWEETVAAYHADVVILAYLVQDARRGARVPRLFPPPQALGAPALHGGDWR